MAKTTLNTLWEMAADALREASAEPARDMLQAFVNGRLPGCSALRGHCERVALFSTQMGEEIGLAGDALARLGLAGLLHDCGKIALDPRILDKPCGLSCDERLYVQTHSFRGAKLLRHIRPLRDLVPAVLHHHERWDGCGYPMGLAGEETPLEARIIAIADSFDAITSPRSYNVNLNATQGFGILHAERGFQFDPGLVDAFSARHDEGAQVMALCAA